MHNDPSKIQEVADAFEKKELFQHFVPTSGEYGDCVDTWGTKWDACGGEIVDQSEDGITLIFDTAWSPPIYFYDGMVEQEFSVEASYFEPGMCFVGRYEDGETDHYEYTDIESLDDIPEELVECYGIREMMEEWEDEES
jgi:hypothetical protein